MTNAVKRGVFYVVVLAAVGASSYFFSSNLPTLPLKIVWLLCTPFYGAWVGAMAARAADKQWPSDNQWAD